MNYRTIVSFFAGPIFSAFIGFILLPMIAWLFTEQDLGRLAMLQVAGSFSVLIFSLGLDQSFVREYHEHNDKNGILKEAVLPGTFVLVLALIILFIYKQEFTRYLYKLDSNYIFWASMIFILLSFFNRFLSLILRMQEKGAAYAVCLIIPKLFVLSLVLVTLAFDFKKNFELLIGIYAASLIGALFLYIIFSAKELAAEVNSSIDKQRILVMINYGGPLMIGGIAHWVLVNIDRLLLNSLADLSELGVFTMANGFASIALVFQTGFSLVWAPTLYKWILDPEKIPRIANIRDKLVVIIVFIFVLAGVFSWLIPLILPNQYWEVQYIMMGCLVYPLLITLSEVTSVGIGISRKTHYAMAASIIAALINTAFGFWLIPIFGAKGAAAATAIAFFVFFVVKTESSIILWQKIPRVKLYLIVSLISLTSIGFTLIGEDYSLVFRLMWVVIALVTILAYRKDVGELFDFSLTLLRQNIFK